MKTFLVGLSASLAILLFVDPVLAQKKGGGGGTTPPPSAPAPEIVYRAQTAAGWVLGVINADGNHDTISAHRGYAPAWRPGGAGSALDPYRFVTMAPSEMQFDLFDVWVENGAVRMAFYETLYSDSVWLTMPAWSPDGQKIAFTREQHTVETIPASGGGVPTVVYTPPSGSVVITVAWFTDSQRIALFERSATGYSIKVHDTVTNTSTVAISEGTIKTQAVMNMASQRNLLVLACQANKDRSTTVYTLDLDAPGSSLVRHFAGAYPAISPDATKIVYSEGSPRYGLRVHDLTTGSTTSLPTAGMSPDWRP